MWRADRWESWARRARSGLERTCGRDGPAAGAGDVGDDDGYSVGRFLKRGEGWPARASRISCSMVVRRGNRDCDCNCDEKTPAMSKRVVVCLFVDFSPRFTYIVIHHPHLL